ncbi:MAG: Succinyl-CoA synthetase (ADP-forming) alpha subunit [Parcubacteria group bacterium GW2011_GWA2_47_26]|nr:MAG: Succinyl-CoA synthetase (ADP-forming) alpha subunit [Parcubacteria group bacterium GW2011_GWA2_47_26]
MGILIVKNTQVLVQGITGKEGQRAAAAMREYGTEVVGGIRPGKGGTQIDGVPVFNSIKEALEMFPRIGVTAIYVPPLSAKEAILEAIEAGLPQINVIVERVPIQDVAYCLAAARERGVQVIGPSSLGHITPGVGRIGVVGGPTPLVDEIFCSGGVGIISRSGGMTNEIAWQVRKAGLGQSTAVHIGGDVLIGTDYADLLRLFEKDQQTKAVIIFGEHGGSYEFAIVELIENKEFTKPLAIYIGGRFARVLPEGMNIGHAGAIVERGRGAVEKEQALKGVGVMVAMHYEELVDLIKPYA